MATNSVESIASIRNKSKETIRVDQLIPAELREKSETLIELLKDYYKYNNEVGNPSYELRSINNARDIDDADDLFVSKLQKEIAYAFPKSISADRIKVYKNLVKYYSLRGSSESISLFFKILFDDSAEVYYPRDDLFVPSDGVWETGFTNTIYTKNPLIYVKGNGTGAYAEATVADGAITSIPVLNSGINYTQGGTTISIVGDGTDAAAKPIIGEGRITSITISSGGGGSGYETAEVVITDSTGGTGSGAEAVAVISSGGTIDQIYLTNPGIGYVDPVVTITGTQSSGGTPAVVTATTDYGQLLSVQITNRGKNYTLGGTTVSVVGDGTLAVLDDPVIKDGVIIAVTPKDQGQNYTVATATVINDENAVVPTSVAVIRPKISLIVPGIDPEYQPAEADVGKIQSYDIIDGGEGYTPKGIFVESVPGGRYTDNRGFPSNSIHIQDSYFWQKFSYVIRTGNQIDVWKNVFNRLVHPAGFIFFGEILILLELLAGKAKMPLSQPGYPGQDEKTLVLLIELLASLTTTFSDDFYRSTLTVSNAVPGSDLVRYEDPMHIGVYSALRIEQADAVSPLYPWGDYTISYASGINTVNTINDVDYAVVVV